MNRSFLPPGEPRVHRACVAAAACVVGVVLVFAVSPVWGQAKKPAAKVPEKTFEDVTLDTKDGVITIATYYPGPEQKTTVPLILVHDWDGNRTELHSLAMFLQQELQHAVIVPDLRGHGVSLRQRGVDEQINREKMNRAAIESAWLDIEAAKAYLMQRNNEGKLNIEQLGVLGTGFGATLAIKWAVRDWNFTSTPALKNGQDVKALILISPRQSFKGVTANQELKSNWLSFMSVLTIVGTQDAARYADAKRMHKAFEAFHRDAPPGVVHLYEADTALQGVDLIMDRNLGVPNLIKDCIRARLVDRGADLPWRDRTSPLK